MATIDLGKIKLVNRGAYNNSTAYTVDDLVQSGGTTYICIQNSTGNAVTNTSYWNVLAQGGDVATTLTTQGDILYRDGSGLQRLAKGTAGTFLKQGTNHPEWADSGGLVIKKHAFWHNDQFENIPSDGTLVLSQPYTTKGANSIFLLDASVYFGHDANTNGDVNNVTMFAWLEDGSGNKYRFGFYKTSGIYAGNSSTLAGNYWLTDCDGTLGTASTWNSQMRTYTNVGGNQTSDQTNYAASTFPANTSLTFKFYLADGGAASGTGNNLDYNRSHANANSQGRSFYCINELKGYE
jgi:hypothetical protein